MRTSYSAISTYLQCPKKYKFQEIDRIRIPKSREAIFGTLIHQTLKFMFKRDPLFPTLDEVIDYFRTNWPSQEIFGEEARQDPLKHPWTGEENKAYFEEGVRMLKKFYEKNAPWNYTVVDLESRFEVTLTNEKTGETHILAGIIDRIDKLPDGTYEIIDYKTSKRMPPQKTLDENLQLSLYSLGLQNRWPHLSAEDIKMSLYFLKHSEKLSTKASEESTRKTKESILNTINEIKTRISAGKEFEPMPSPLCDWCSFKPMCPAWKHLYKNQESGIRNQEEVDGAIKEYFELKRNQQKSEKRLSELQQQIKDYMNQEKLTRVFGTDGTISQKTVQRYEYDWEKVKSLLSPINKWEEILKADEAKLRHMMREIPEETRLAIENVRFVSKEYLILTASTKRTIVPKSTSNEESKNPSFKN